MTGLNNNKQQWLTGVVALLVILGCASVMADEPAPKTKLKLGAGMKAPATAGKPKMVKPVAPPAETNVAEEPAAVPAAPAARGVTASMQKVNGRKVVTVSDDNRTILIIEQPSGSVSVLLTTFKDDDSDEVKRYHARSVEELSVKHPEGFKLYQAYSKVAEPKLRPAGGAGGLAESLGIDGLDSGDLDASLGAAKEKARKELEKLREADGLDDGAKALLEKALQGLNGAGIP